MMYLDVSNIGYKVFLLYEKAEGYHRYVCTGKPMPYTELGTRILSI